MNIYITQLTEAVLQGTGVVKEPATAPINFEAFCRFIISTSNDVMKDDRGVITHDMTRPLAHYWIASSHNTCVQATCSQMSSLLTLMNDECILP